MGFKKKLFRGKNPSSPWYIRVRVYTNLTLVLKRGLHFQGSIFLSVLYIEIWKHICRVRASEFQWHFTLATDDYLTEIMRVICTVILNNGCCWFAYVFHSSLIAWTYWLLSLSRRPVWPGMQSILDCLPQISTAFDHKIYHRFQTEQ